jgi:ribosome recycling factor
MNNYIAIELSEFQKKMNGYLMMFNYRLTNYCVKAEPTAMLTVTVMLTGKEFNFEEVAYATKPDDYTFDVYPKNQNNLQAIIDGVFDMHPEFKMEIKTDKNNNNEPIRHVIYTMPEVNKDRHDLLTETSKTFHQECLAYLDACYAKQQTKIVDALTQMPANEVDEARAGFKNIYDDARGQARQLLDAKLSEIEEGYQRYLTQQETAGNGEYMDYTKGVRLDQMED